MRNREDGRNPYFLKLLSGGGSRDENEELLEKFRQVGRNFDPANIASDNLNEVTLEALDFIEKGVRKPLSEEDRMRYIAHLEKLSFIRAQLDREQNQEQE